MIAVPEATLDIGWELLSALPEEELNPIDEKLIEEYSVEEDESETIEAEAD
jgi:V/A-type H+-transporting ATPase subunit B